MPFMKRSRSCGTSTIIVTRRSFIVLKSTVAWRAVGYVMFAPERIGTRRPPICSSMWLRGRIDISRSDSLPAATCTTDAMLAVMLRWVSMTPFGSPVVPDVNITSARSSRPMSTGVGAGMSSDSASSSSKSISGTPSSPW